MNAEKLIPLKPDVFHILLVLLEGPRHGYAIMRDVAESSAGHVRILPGALYRHLQRMLEDGIIGEVEPSGDAGAGGDTRRRCYEVTEFGRAVAEAEATRLARLVRAASAKKLVKEGIQ